MRLGPLTLALCILHAAPISVRDIYNGSLDPATQLEAFRHIDRLFPSRIVAHGSPYPLPQAPRALRSLSFVYDGSTVTLDRYLHSNRVTGLLILKNGTITHESYRLGNTSQTRWASWSVVKSMTSTLLGAAIQDRYIASLDERVTQYLPELSHSAYDSVTLRDLVQMTSGVRWSETYTEPGSDRRRMLELQMAQRPGIILQFLRTLPRAAPPGTQWNYSTGDSHVLGAVIRAAVRRPLSQYLSEKIWKPFGMESDATWWLESPDGLEIGGSGFSATLRDYARFGLLVLNGGKAGGRQLVPANWFRDAGMPKQVGGKMVDYGYMWWSMDLEDDPIHRGAFEATGIFGQFLYINPRHNVVIAVWSARPSPSGGALIDDNDFFAAVTRALSSVPPDQK